MKIAIHQPEHFPYLGYFKKMENADLFVILDDSQFSKGNWHNRNKFLNKNNTEEWFTVQLKKFQLGEKINNIYCAQDSRWKNKIIKKLFQNFGFDLSKIYDNEKLINVNMEGILFCRKKLNINTEMIYSSDLNLNPKLVASKKLAEICSLLKADTYISGIGGKNYLDQSMFNCEIEYYQPKVKDYYTTLSHIS